MRPTDTTPIQDPRNAVGLMIDVAELTIPTDDSIPDVTNSVFITARDLGREFSRASRRVFNGYRRQDGADLYERTQRVYRDELRDHSKLMIRPGSAAERTSTITHLFERALGIAELVMRNFDGWKAYTHEQVPPRSPYSGVRATTPALWAKTWHDFVSTALRAGVDGTKIELIECNWRFRDLTDRKHRGLNRRAAFEAAWLVGNYKFAKQLLE
jgi:hypothetical protein